MARCRARSVSLLGLVALAAILQSAPLAQASLPGCEAASGANTPSSPGSHPLACRIFGTGGTEVAWDALVDRLAASTVALLGEVHDNGDHHRIRAQLILALEARRGGEPRPALVLEHIRADQDLALAALRALDRRERRSVADLFAALSWETSGWPDKALFQPLFEAALDAEWPILAGDLPSADIRAVARQGLAALPASELQRLGLATPLPAPAQADLLDELEKSHCGLLPKSAFGAMADAQRYRDAYMAHAVLDAERAHGRAILLAGNGHVRSDRGVPWHLRRLAPDARLATVMFLEVEGSKPAALDYLIRGSLDEPMADVVVLTRRAERPDPCTEMRKRFGK